MGTTGGLADLRDPYLHSLMDDYLEDFAAPSQFYSNQSGLLGQVKFPGQVELELLIDKLNLQLQFVGEESGGFDFRTAYPRWSYRYQIIERIGLVDNIIAEASDSRPKRRGR